MFDLMESKCLNFWFAAQLCGHRFSFTPVYRSNAPGSLPIAELLWGLLNRGAKGFGVGLRVSAPFAACLGITFLMTVVLNSLKQPSLIERRDQQGQSAEE